MAILVLCSDWLLRHCSKCFVRYSYHVCKYVLFYKVSAQNEVIVLLIIYCCCSLLVVFRVRLALVTVILSSSFLSSAHFSLTAFLINNLQLLLSFAVVLHSPPTLSRSLITQSVTFSVFLASFHFLGIWSLSIFHLPFFPHVRPISTYSSLVSS